MVGGILEYSALAVGYRSLAILVAVLYGIAYLVWARDSAATSSISESSSPRVEVGAPV